MGGVATAADCGCCCSLSAATCRRRSSRSLRRRLFSSCNLVTSSFGVKITGLRSPVYWTPSGIFRWKNTDVIPEKHLPRATWFDCRHRWNGVSYTKLRVFERRVS
ncbi:hypothetical protein B5X24_HaOG214165 [Helicoverpa armigera]|uniref:Uncharacterized protein n=1 Tax=Helicoverpa armigera TaxID=29058 RepID=A0A2W1BDV3_HELAM|nr:hypothetical protein B5X24_HaOG214165 [Helicoverpa armigera]